MAHFFFGGGGFSFFWDAFEIFRKATVSFVIFICLSVSMEHLPLERMLMKFRIWAFFFRKSVLEMQVSLKFDKNNAYYT